MFNLFQIVDASRTADEVFSDVINIVKETIGSEKNPLPPLQQLWV